MSPSAKAADQTKQTNGKANAEQIKTLAVRFWKFLNTNSAETFLDADIKVVANGIGKFLNKDIFGRKIIVLSDKDKLDETASAVAIFLKRRRHIFKNKDQKENIQAVKILHQYYNHPFWKRSKSVRKSRRLLNTQLRRLTPKLIAVLQENKQKLEGFFEIEKCWDDKILLDDVRLKQQAATHSYRLYTVCQMHGEPVALNKNHVVFCSNEECSTPVCPFESNLVLEEEMVFFSDLHKLLEGMGKL
jgi:hypothetical protein